jgi:hypothetical protein
VLAKATATANHVTSIDGLGKTIGAELLPYSPPILPCL